MDLGFIKCYSGLDRFSVLSKTEKWLSEYRNLKIKYLKDGSFTKDHSVLLSQITKKELNKLKSIKTKLGLVKFTPTRAQFLNEKKFLKQKLKTEKISYRKLRNIHAVCEEYRLHYKNEDFDSNKLKDLIWWSIATYTYEGTGQEKIASRLNRNRVVINRKLKNNPYIQTRNKFLLLKRIQLNKITNIVERIKSNEFVNNKGLKVIAKYSRNGSRQMFLAKQMPNEYQSKTEINQLITKTNKKTFFYTKRDSNKAHIKNINEDQFRVHEKISVKTFNDVLFAFNDHFNGTKTKYSSVWNKRKNFFYSEENGRKFLLNPTKNLKPIIRTFLNREEMNWKRKEVMVL